MYSELAHLAGSESEQSAGPTPTILGYPAEDRDSHTVGARFPRFDPERSDACGNGVGPELAIWTVTGVFGGRNPSRISSPAFGDA